MPYDLLPIPKLRAGCRWIPLPKRSLSSLIAESFIPILNPDNQRHFILLTKYRPQISFYKSITSWDIAWIKAKELFLLTFPVKTDQQSFEIEPEETLSAPNLIIAPNTIKTTVDQSLTPRPGSSGWPNLHTARRCLTRQYPHNKVSNEEIYASLRKPPVVDILGPNWQEKHKKVQSNLLKRSSEHSRLIPQEKTHSKFFSARSMTNSLNSSIHFRSSLHSIPWQTLTLTQHRPQSAHIVTYTPMEKPIQTDILAPDWKEQHRKRQERLLQQKDSRDRKLDIVLSPRSVAATAVSVLRKPPEMDRKIQTVQSQLSVARTFVCSPKSPLKMTKMEKRKSSLRTTVESDERFNVEAELGIIKDWLRTQPSHSDQETRNIVNDLKENIKLLASKQKELKSTVENIQRKNQTDIASQFATFAESLRHDILMLMTKEREKCQTNQNDQVHVENIKLSSPKPSNIIVKDNNSNKVTGSNQSDLSRKRNFWVSESSHKQIPNPKPSGKLPQSNDIPSDQPPPNVLKVRTIQPFHATLASQCATTRLSRGEISCRKNRERSLSVTTINSSSSCEKRKENSFRIHNQRIDFGTSPIRLPVPVQSKNQYTSTSEVNKNIRQVDASTQSLHPQEKTNRKMEKLLGMLVKALVNSDRRLAKSRQEILILRGIVEQSTVRIGVTVESLQNLKKKFPPRCQENIRIFEAKTQTQEQNYVNYLLPMCGRKS